MGALIRNRTASALRRVRKVLRTGLADQLDAINTDLGSDSDADYTLPASIPDEDLDIVAQGPVLPGGNTPAIRITSARTPEVLKALGGLSHGQVAVEVHSLLAFEDLTVADPRTVTETDEATLVQAVHDMSEAIKLTLTKLPGGVLGNDGLQRIEGITDDFVIQDIDDADAAITLRGVFGLVLRQRKDFRS